MSIGAAVAALMAASCSSDKESKSSATLTTVSSTVAPPATTATTAAPPTTATPGGDSLSKGPPYERTSGPSGSGCTPPARIAELPAGWWAGKLSAVQATTFDFDLRCWFSGQAAIKAGTEDGNGPVEDDYYVRDAHQRFRESFSSASTRASCVGDANEPFACTVGDVLALYGNGSTSGKVGGREVTAFPTVWLHVDAAGRPDYLYMQFTP